MDAIVHAPFTEVNHTVYQQSVYLSDNPLMETSYDRLLKAASIMKGWNTPSEVARGLTLGGYKVSAQVMTNWKNRGTVSIEGMTEIARVIGCLYEWLKNGTGPMESAIIPLHHGWANVTEGPEIVGKIPLISWVQAGAFCGVVDLYAPGDAEAWLPTLKKYGPHAYALRVQGDSMVSPYPGQRSYPPGYILFVDPDRAVTNGCRIIAKLPDTDEATFKIYAEDSGQRYLKPLNPQYPTLPIGPGVALCGVVVGGFWEE